MNAGLARRLRSAFWITLVCLVVSMVYETLSSGQPSIIGFSIGIGLGVCLALLEESRFAKRMVRLPFALATLSKTAVYVLVPTFVFLLASLIFGLLQGLSMSVFWDQFAELDFYVQVGTAFVLYLIIIFFRQLDRLLGPGVLLKVLVGKYHRPKREHRVFMFLDLKSSTSIAEQLTPESYYRFLNDFFGDLSLPILNAGGSIYQYVGDEVVVTWKQNIGANDANCLRVFLAIDEAIRSREQHYLDRYGIVPEYKAGAHLGEVITAEIGDLKKEIVYTGDVLNTAARIQSMCNDLGRRFVISKQLADALVVPDVFMNECLGAITLRGKAAPVELIGVA